MRRLLSCRRLLLLQQQQFHSSVALRSARCSCVRLGVRLLLLARAFRLLALVQEARKHQPPPYMMMIIVESSNQSSISVTDHCRAEEALHSPYSARGPKLVVPSEAFEAFDVAGRSPPRRRVAGDVIGRRFGREHFSPPAPQVREPGNPRAVPVGACRGSPIRRSVPPS